MKTRMKQGGRNKNDDTELEFQRYKGIAVSTFKPKVIT
jgi:hypothetical protein